MGAYGSWITSKREFLDKARGLALGCLNTNSARSVRIWKHRRGSPSQPLHAMLKDLALSRAHPKPISQKIVLFSTTSYCLRVPAG